MYTSRNLEKSVVFMYLEIHILCMHFELLILDMKSVDVSLDSYILYMRFKMHSLEIMHSTLNEIYI